MSGGDERLLVDLIGRAARPLEGGPGAHDPLLGLIGSARFVPLGEASHATREFHAERARITQRLVAERGFTAVAVIALVLGIGANTAIFSVVNAVLLRPLPYYEPDQLVMVFESRPQRGVAKTLVSLPDFLDWRSRNKGFEDMVAFDYLGNLSGREPFGKGGEPTNVGEQDGRLHLLTQRQRRR